MSKIEKLVSELCPNGVKFKLLEEIADISTGSQLNKTAMSATGKYPVLNGGINPSGCYEKYNTDADTIAISQGGASAGFVNYVREKFWAGAHCFVVKTTNKDVLNRFVYFVLKEGQSKLMDAKLGAGIPGLNRNELKKFLIPVPPLAIQEETIKILDNFIELEAELETKLEAELEARKKQYEYFQTKLLVFDERVRKVNLAEVAKIYDGTHQTPKYTSEGVPFVSVENIRSLCDTKKYISREDYEKYYKIQPQIGDVFMTRIGVIGTCAIVDRDDDLAYYVTLALIRPDDEYVLPKFLKYIIESRVGQSELQKRTLVNAVPIKINLGDIGKIKIPIPSITEQKKIVAILDRFDVLVNDILIGLPAELVARRKQYEYYRNKLLTFKENAG